MHPLSLLIKPASGSCNLRCGYCFYADEMRTRDKADFGRMSEDTLKALIKKSMEFAEGSVSFVFQGGEPTLMGQPFFEKFISLKNQYARNHLAVSLAVQTNGTLLDEKFAAFLAEEKFLTGLSLDGPRSVHDVYRLDLQGAGTFKSTMHAAAILRDAGAEFNILTVLTEKGGQNIDRIYNFLTSRGFYYQQYIPCLDPLAGCSAEPAEYSLTAKTFGEALKTLFDLWYADVTAGVPVHNRYFENLIGILSGIEPESCDMRGQCSVQYVIEADGSVYPCDFYVLDGYCLGNIRENSFEEIDRMRKQAGFIESSLKIDEKCRACPYFILCRGGCRRNRENYRSKQLELNRFCESYRAFFKYAGERLKKLALGDGSQMKKSHYPLA